MARCYFAIYSPNSCFLHTLPWCFNTLTSLPYFTMLHLSPLHHISLHVQNLFPVLGFSFGHSLQSHQNQISCCFLLPDIFPFDKVIAQLIHFLFFSECSNSTSFHNYFSHSFISGDFLNLSES